MKTTLNNTEFTHYIALYDQGIVYGTGTTRRGCVRVARFWAGGGILGQSGNLSGIEIYSATRAAYNYARRHGGDARPQAFNVNPHRLEVSLIQAER
ncbi:MAG: hypothetical protein J0M00_06705 [Burkholderiales bacterium]|nr:hypothetical protein [Burkholderiales bacterium]